MFQLARIQSRGVSVVEILIALGVLAVIISFASTSFGHAANKAELHAVAEGVNFSIQGARSAARELETEVIMHLQSDRPGTQNSISFSMPNRNRELGASNLLEEYQLPGGIRLVATESIVQFDSRGLVQTPVTLELVSMADQSLHETLLVQ